MNAFHELQAKGFIAATSVGSLGLEGCGKATTYRLTECGTRERCEGTKDFLNWRKDRTSPCKREIRPRRDGEPNLASEKPVTDPTAG